jgi:hypothetical protein
MNKEEFVSKLKQQEQQNTDGKAQQQADIAEFQLRVRELTSLIKGWLENVPSVQVSVASMPLPDSTLFDKSSSTYPIDFITITANGRSLQLKPNALYLMGAKGLVHVAFNGVRVGQEYSLIMRDGEVPDGEWAFVTTVSIQGNRKTRKSVKLDEDVFFELLSKLIE